MGGLSIVHWIILAAIGILLFGKRLPEVGRSLGKGIVEFKKGLRGMEDELDPNTMQTVRPETPALEPPRPPQRVTATAPKFEETASSDQITRQPTPPVV